MLSQIAITVLYAAVGLIGLAAGGIFCAYSLYAASYSPFAEALVLERRSANVAAVLIRSLRNAVGRYLGDWFGHPRCPATDTVIFLASLFTYGLMIAVGLTPLTGWAWPWRFLLAAALLPLTILLYSLAEAFHTLTLLHADRPTALLRILARAHTTACINPDRYSAAVQALRSAAADMNVRHEPILRRLLNAPEDSACPSLPSPSRIAAELLDCMAKRTG